MCMIAHRFLSAKGKGQNIPNAVVDTAMNRHPDGFGIAWRDPEKGLVYEKFGPRERVQFRSALKAIDLNHDIEYVAHFRYATHGPEDRAHAHPYTYQDPDPKVGEVLVFHNGIITGVTTTKLESDTEVFVRDYLARLPSKWWNNAGIRKLVDHMGGWSRLVLMTKHETVNLNHYAGDEDGGLWYSSYHEPSQSKYTNWSSWDNEDEEWTRTEEGDWIHSLDAAERRMVSEATSDGVQGIPLRVVVSAEIGETTNPRANDAMWMHNGHELQPLQTFDFKNDGDYEASVICDTCQTFGDVYIIDGKAYIDIGHKWDVTEDEDDTEDSPILLPERGLSLVPSIPTGASGTDYVTRMN